MKEKYIKMNLQNNMNDINSDDNNTTNNQDNSELAWSIINSYFDTKHLKQLVKHQIESYNYFINSQLQDTINMFNPITITSDQFYNRTYKVNTLEVLINFDNLSIHRPQLHENNGATKLMFPQDARLRNFTYASNMLVDLNIEFIFNSWLN